MSIKKLICDFCELEFAVTDSGWSTRRFKKRKYGINHYCSFDCKINGKGQRSALEVVCSNCKTTFHKSFSEIKKVNNHFCSQSCAATYNNKNKTKGNRRSKLEIWLEGQLTMIYPNLEILYSDKTYINSELDIHIPSLKLAFELNGIFHYEPIFGESKLDQIKNNDGRKFQACLEKGIELCIIDTSLQKYFKESTSKKYLDIITKLVNMKLSKTDCVEVL